MTIMSGNFPKAMQGGKKMKSKPMSQIMKQDKKADAKMTPAQMRKDIAADKKLLKQKESTKKKK